MQTWHIIFNAITSSTRQIVGASTTIALSAWPISHSVQCTYLTYLFYTGIKKLNGPTDIEQKSIRQLSNTRPPYLLKLQKVTAGKCRSVGKIVLNSTTVL